LPTEQRARPQADLDQIPEREPSGAGDLLAIHHPARAISWPSTTTATVHALHSVVRSEPSLPPMLLPTNGPTAVGLGLGLFYAN
jgi:hypothetical protein